MTQDLDEAPSLTDTAESCAEAVWQQHCRDQELPPVWIERLFPGAFGREPEFRLVTFGETEPHQDHDPHWDAISAEQVVHLVGGRSPKIVARAVSIPLVASLGWASVFRVVVDRAADDLLGLALYLLALGLSFPVRSHNWSHPAPVERGSLFGWLRMRRPKPGS
ncbi:hypothetical protein [Streptomyces sp. NBC_00343]|uniref:hypothetical protein n=1 Tax=Streptomyces sp. NBC_00343 TaxID=2975719 RepID=UPI002E287D29|nr:hypothetical protein [Streptomyces sp. NBC_00343]